MHIDELRRAAEAAISAYRAATDDPVVLQLDSEYAIEISAPGETEMTLYLARGNSGSIRARFTESIAQAAFYEPGEDALEAYQVMNVSLDELSGIA